MYEFTVVICVQHDLPFLKWTEAIWTNMTLFSIELDFASKQTLACNF